MEIRADVRSYLEEELEIEISNERDDDNLVDLLISTDLHPDEKVFFILNFMDEYNIYSKERDFEYNFSKFIKPPFSRFEKVLLKLYNSYWYWDSNFLKYVDYDDLTIKELYEMAKTKHWETKIDNNVVR